MFKTISDKIDEFNQLPIIWGGDFNFVWNIDIDKIGGQQRTNFNARREVLNMMHVYDLKDIWRDRNPRTKNYTWHSNVDKCIHCRLDFLIISNHLCNNVLNATISPIFGSDHSSVTLCLNFSNKRGRGSWKLNTSLLNDDIYKEKIRSTVNDIVSNSNYFHNAMHLWEVLKLNIMICFYQLF